MKKRVQLLYQLNLILLFFLGSNIIYSQSNSAKISNFRIENAHKDRIYFDVEGNISKLSIQGFKISGNSISGLNKNSKYFTVKKSFSFWDNNTIRLEKGNGVVSDFALTHIKNKINEPKAKREEWYVNSKIKRSGDGKSPNSAFKTIMEAVKSIKKGGATIHIKAGNYGGEFIQLWGVLPASSKSNPFILQGYRSKPGDLNGVNFYTYSKGKKLEATKAPLLDGKDRSKGTAISLAGGNGVTNRDFIILRNIQIQNFQKGIMSNQGKNLIVENCVVRNIGTGSRDHGIHFFKARNIRISKSISINSSVAAFNIEGDFNAVYDCKAFGEDSGGLKMDYYFSLQGRNNIFMNNLSKKILKDGKDWEHGFSVSGDKVGDTEFNLIENHEATGGVRGIELRRGGCSHNVVRSLYSHDTELGIQIRDGSNNNIIENSVFNNVVKGIDFSASDEAGFGSALNNTFRNVIISNAKKVLYHRGRSIADRPEVRGNKFYNLTIVNSNTLWSNYEVKPKTSSNEWVNCNIIDVSSQGFSNGQSFSNSNFYGSFQSLVGKSSNISKDPAFRNKNNRDFRLKSTSKLINAGKKLSSVLMDFEGSKRPQGSSHDIGAYEYGEKTINTINADAGDDVSICKGEKVTLTATGGKKYKWSNGKTTPTITISPSKTITLTVTVSDGITTDEAKVKVTVNEVRANAGKDVSIEEGDEVTLTATGGDTYLWSTGETTQSITVSPTKTKGYEVKVKSGDCEDSDRVKVTVKKSTPPVVAVVNDDLSICKGEEVVLSAGGGDTYSWSTGSTSSEITISPEETTTYTVTVSDGITTDEAKVKVTVNEVRANAGKDVSIEEGDEVTL
ncbi:hypothetical protein LCM02_01195, partial [Lutimonas saemankumensis]|uniref:right-handed parallel beta-helix repeat-containing protein n=1 Tax=Lutimonas saemankumensis TaxID=483016 RepID=UPI00293D5DAD